MKSSYESAEHRAIHTIKEEVHTEALEYLRSGKIGRRLNEIIGDNSTLWATVERIITRELNGSERWKIRDMALGKSREQKRELQLQGKIRWLLKRVKAANWNTESWEEEHHKPLYTLETIRDWLGQLGNIETIEKPGESGTEFFASIWGITLWRSLLVGSPHDKEIRGETAEAAIKNYFTEARLATAIGWQNWKKYKWSQKDLQFIEEKPRERSILRTIIRRKQLKRRKYLELNDWQK